MMWFSFHNSRKKNRCVSLYFVSLFISLCCMLLFCSFSTIWFVFKSDRTKHSTQHPSVRSSRLAKYSKKGSFVDDTLNLCQLAFSLSLSPSHSGSAFSIRVVKWTATCTFIPTWLASIFLFIHSFVGFFFFFYPFSSACLMKGEILFIDSHWTPIGNTTNNNRTK